MNRALFVSRRFPHDIAKSVHGVYMRMRLFLGALSKLAEKIDMLFYVEEGVDASSDAMRKTEDDFVRVWGMRTTVTLCPVAQTPAPVTFWKIQRDRR